MKPSSSCKDIFNSWASITVTRTPQQDSHFSFRVRVVNPVVRLFLNFSVDAIALQTNANRHARAYHAARNAETGKAVDVAPVVIK